MKVLTSFAVINGKEKRIAYTFDVVDEENNLISSNNKDSYLVKDKEDIDVIKQLEETIRAKMSKE